MPKKCLTSPNEPSAQHDPIQKNPARRAHPGASNALRLITITLIALIFVERPLHAYADPGSGLLIWQLLGAVVVGAVYQARRAVKRFKSLASLRMAASSSPGEASQSSAVSGQAAAADGSSQGATVRGVAHDGLFLS